MSENIVKTLNSNEKTKLRKNIGSQARNNTIK